MDSWDVSLKLQRFLWLLHAHNVEVKARRLAWAIRAKFNPNQPRVPRGNPDGGQWTNGGGGGVQVAQNIPPEEETRRDFESESLGQRAEAVNAQAQELIRRVHEIDPNWRPTENLVDPDNIETQIDAANNNRIDAAARLRELGQETPEDLIAAFRQRDATYSWMSSCLTATMLWLCVPDVDPLPLVSIRRRQSRYIHRGMRPRQWQCDEHHCGQPRTCEIGPGRANAFECTFHAETTSLPRAARDNGGTLEGQEIDVYVDGIICNHCKEILPEVIKRLGNPTVRFADKRGYYVNQGQWLPRDNE